MPMVEGRPLSDDEQNGGADAVVISRALARVVFGSRSAVGGTLDYSGRQWTIVGVVPDSRWRLDEAPFAEVYLPWQNARQRPQAIVVRTSGASPALPILVSQRLRAIDPGATIAQVSSLQERVAVTLAPQRFRAMLLASLAGLAALLGDVRRLQRHRVCGRDRGARAGDSGRARRNAPAGALARGRRVAAHR